MTSPRMVSCPQCKTPVEWTSQSLFRPFCSERCKLIDLGAWATGAYRVAAVEPADDFDAPVLDDDVPRGT